MSDRVVMLRAVLIEDVTDVSGPTKNLIRAVANARAHILRLCLAAFFSALSIDAAHAFDIPSAPLPPVHNSVDQNGVSHLTGGFSFSMPGISIGTPGSGGLSYVRRYDSARQVLEDNFLSGISADGNNFTVTLFGATTRFTKSGSTFTAADGALGTLTFNSGSNTYTYVTPSGAIATYSQGNWATRPTNVNTGTLTTLVYPTGETLTFAYDFVAAGVGEIGYRLMSVNNNFGYQIKFEYATGSSYGESWIAPIEVTALNNAVEYCSPTSNGCTFSNSWPTLTFSGDYLPDTVTDSLSNTWTFTYGTGGVTEIETPEGVTRTIAYSGASGIVTSYSDGVGTWTYALSNHDPGSTRTVTMTDPASEAWVTLSDRANGRVLTQYFPSGRTVSYAYGALGRLTSTTYSTGQVEEYEYDARGNLTRTVLNSVPSGSEIETSATYASSCTNAVTCNLPVTTTDALGNVTNYTYDSTHGGVLTVQAPDPDGGGSAARPQVTYTYDTRTSRYYVAPGNFDPSGPIYVPISLSACSTVTASTCSGNVNETITTIAYPSAGTPNNLQPVSSSVGAGNGSLTAVTTFTYDGHGNVLTVDGPLSGTDDTVRYVYDGLRRAVGVMSPDPDGGGSLLPRGVKTTFNDDGQVVSAQQGNVNASFQWSSFAPLQEETTSYNAQGRALRSDSVLRHGTNGAQSTLAGVTQYAYLTSGRLDCVTVRLTLTSIPGSACTGASGAAGADRITRYGYDDEGRVVTVTSAHDEGEERTEITHYTSEGEVDWVEDGEGNRTGYAYDTFGRLYRTCFGVSGACPGSPSDYEQYTYNAAGSVTVLRLRSGQNVTFTFDALGRATAIDMPSSDPDFTTAYDNLGRVTSASITSHALTFAYDALSRLTSEVSPLGTVSYQYDLASRRTQLTYPCPSCSFYVSYDYNAVGEVTAIRENGASSGAGVLAQYAYDNRGRRVSIARAGGAGAATTFTYDSDSLDWSFAHDLASTANDVNLSFTSNPAGQLTSRVGNNSLYTWAPSTGSTQIEYASNNLNQITAVNAATPTYDARGNMTNDTARGFGYDFSNRLTSSASNSLSYDPIGRLYQTVLSSITTRYLYDGAEVIAEYDGSNALQRRYVRGPGADDPIVWYEGSGTSDRRWLMADERGSVIAIANASGTMQSINSYDEFGLPASGNAGRFQYTGQMWVSELGVYHYKARAYHPTLGRFLQTDSLGFAAGDMNLYVYVGNDPINATDPLGLYDITVRGNACTERNDYCGQSVTLGCSTYSFMPCSPGGGLVYEPPAALTYTFGEFLDDLQGDRFSCSETGEPRLGLSPGECSEVLEAGVSGRTLLFLLRGGVRFGGLRDHALRHGPGLGLGTSRAAYLRDAIRHMSQGSHYRFRAFSEYTGRFETRVASITARGGGEYVFTSSNLAGSRIYTHLVVPENYLVSLGIKLP